MIFYILNDSYISEQSILICSISFELFSFLRTSASRSFVSRLTLFVVTRKSSSMLESMFSYSATSTSFYLISFSRDSSLEEWFCSSIFRECSKFSSSVARICNILYTIVLSTTTRDWEVKEARRLNARLKFFPTGFCCWNELRFLLSCWNALVISSS